MSIPNASFETPWTYGAVHEGLADSWQGALTGGTSWDFGQFTSMSFLAEDFGQGWLDNHLRRDEFGTGELNDSSFDGEDPETVEDYEEEWSDFIALTNDVYIQYEAHRVNVTDSVHGAADSTNVVTATAPATTHAEAVALLNDVKAQYEAHRQLTAGTVHGAADAVHVITSANATNWYTASALANELKLDINAHRVYTTSSVHGAATDPNEVTEINVLDARRAEFGITDLSDGTFDVSTPEAIEDFEEEWSSNEDVRSAFGVGELDDGTFDSSTPEAMEDYEEEWNSNEDRRTAFGGGELDSATFVIATGTQTYESFEDGNLMDTPAGVAVGLTTDLDPTMPSRVEATGTLTGELELQVRVDGFAAWITYDVITSVPAQINLPAGYREARIERTISGGTTKVVVLWQELTEL